VDFEPSERCERCERWSDKQAPRAAGATLSSTRGRLGLPPQGGADLRSAKNALVLQP
jgi:hypothetical protein